MRTKIYRDGKVHIMARKCDTCIFRPGNKMQLSPGRVKGMVDACLKKDIAIICHEVMDDRKRHAVCRGFFDLHWQDVFPLRMAKGFDKIQEVEPWTKTNGTN